VPPFACAFGPSLPDVPTSIAGASPEGLGPGNVSSLGGLHREEGGGQAVQRIPADAVA
jgi:hypothetical protein